MTARNIQSNGTAPPVTAGVIGVGSMGRNHARVYSELPGVTLAGVHDVNTDQATAVADEYETAVLSTDELLSQADLVSVAVPTPYHYDTVLDCLDAGTHALVEKPFVEDPQRGDELVRRAREAGVTIQVGHIERFNPATRVLADIVPDLDVVAIDIERLGPPVDRGGDDSVVMDLMIHDVDILLSLVDSELETVSAMSRGPQYTSSQLQFADCIATLTASRLTQQKVRKLSVTAKSCRVNVDFIDQTVEIHRRSLPEYVESDGDVRFRHESVVERPMVENGEPLKHELAAFVEAATNGTEPIVTATEALDAIELARRIESLTQREPVEA